MTDPTLLADTHLASRFTPEEQAERELRYETARDHLKNLNVDADVADNPETETKPTDTKPRTNFILVENKPYFQVESGEGEYTFAHLADGDIQFIDRVGDYEPQPLPVVNGKPLRLVLMPDVDVKNVKLKTPAELFDKLKNHLTRYVDLSPLDFELCIYYIIFTWFSALVNVVGYLRLLGDTGKGKSRALKVTGDLMFYAILCSGASTFSGIARTKEKYKGTPIIDEADIAGDASHTLIKYLNLGFERGKFFIMSDKKNPRVQDIFDPFCPKVIAMRKPYEDNATEGRLLSISMHETGNKTMPIILPDSYEVETQQLRNDLCLFALRNWANVDGHRMTDMAEINIEPRLKQLGMPLSIIFQLWPEGEARFIEYLINRQQEIRRIRATSWDGTLVNTVIQLATGEIDLPQEFDKYKVDRLPAAITPGMVAKISGSTAKSATKQLAGCGFEVDIKLCHVDGLDKNMTVRAYQVPDSKTWREILSRYYISNEDSTPEIPKNLRGKFYQEITHITNITQKDIPSSPVVDIKEGVSGVSFMPKSVISVISVINDGPLTRLTPTDTPLTDADNIPPEEPPLTPADDVEPDGLFDDLEPWEMEAGVTLGANGERIIGGK